MKALLFICILFYSVFGFSSDSSEKSITLKWVLEHRPAKYFQIAAEKFKEVAEAESKGKIKIEIEQTTLEDQNLRLFRRASKERLKKDQTNIAQIYTFRLAKHAPVLNVLELPYLFEDNDHVSRVIEGEIGEELLAKASSDGFRALAFTYSGGFENIVTIKKYPLKAATDLEKINNRNISYATTKILNILDKSFQDNGKDDYVNFNNGDIHAISATNSDLPTLLEKSTPINYYATNHSVLFTAITMNEKIYGSLSKNFKAILKKAAMEAARVERVAVVQDGEKELKILKTQKYVTMNEANSPFCTDLRNKLKNAENHFGAEIKDYALRIRGLGKKANKTITKNP